MEMLTALARRPHMEAANRASIFAELADKATRLPKESRQEALKAAQDTLIGSPPGAEPHSAALYCLGRLCLHDPSLVSPALCNLLARCMQSALQDDDHLELQEAASTLQCCMRAVNESADEFWMHAPTLLVALLETATLPVCHVLADPSLRPTDTRIAPLSQLLKTMYELLPDWRAEASASEHRLQHGDWDEGGSLQVASTLCRLCRCLITVCLAEFRRPSTVFILMNNAWQLLMRAVGMPLLKRAVVASAGSGADDESGFSQVPSQLQTCVLEPLLAYFPRAVDAIVRQRSSVAAPNAASGAGATQPSIKIARFALSQLKAFATVYGDWAAREAATRSSSAIELHQAMATLCVSLQTSVAQEKPSPSTPQSDVEGLLDKLSESLSTCAILLLQRAEQMGPSKDSPSPTPLLRAWASMAEAELAASGEAFAMVKSASVPGADAASRALLLAQTLCWSAASKLPREDREAAASLLLPLIFRLLGRAHTDALPHGSVAVSGTVEGVPPELAGACCKRQPIEAVRALLIAYMHACIDGPAQAPLLVALLNASLARQTAPRLLATELWCYAIQQVSVAEGEKQLLVLWDLASRLHGCEEAAFQQHSLVRLLSSALLALPLSATDGATKAMGEHILAASACAQNAAIDSNLHDASPLLAALEVLCEVRCLSAQASVDNARNPFAADAAAWLRELLDACQMQGATDTLRVKLLRAACALSPFVARAGLLTHADTEQLRLLLCEQLRAADALASAAAASSALCLCVLPMPMLQTIAALTTKTCLESVCDSVRKMNVALMLSALLQRESSPQTLQDAALGVRRLLSSSEGAGQLGCESERVDWLARLQAVRAAALFTQIAPEESVASVLGELQASGEQLPLCDFLQQSAVASASVDDISKDVLEEQRVLGAAADYVERHAKRRKVARTMQLGGGVVSRRTEAAQAKPAEDGAREEGSSVGACAIGFMAAALDSLRQDSTCLQDDTSVGRLNQLLRNPHLAGANAAELATLRHHVDNWINEPTCTSTVAAPGFL